MSDITANVNSFPQTAELKNWIVAQIHKGLVDVKFFARRNDDATVESFCGELNQMLKSPVVPDADLT